MIIGNKLDLYVKDTHITMGEIHKRKDNSKRLESMINLVRKDLKKNFGFVDLDNVMFLSQLSDEVSFRRLDAFVKSASQYEGDIGTDGEDINAGNYTVGGCLFLKRFGEEFDRPKGWVNTVIGWFVKDKKECLPI